ncbi:hypothetical protein I6F65_04765 [Pseudoalteromonas sp. SWXJZ94C]|uniref:hypothetical protein n=1 Tax=Pseudoalteromonas sp. SWXJZ94C TaxID=2792065 RepID=UPI0018CFC1E5|nr:hypothetical protein [Pseudoalteromonas sp. SWXJZ94C]MBH0056264.1 hypothetical protein [Pseudoalteromonas sp. SWXJZ94C]
MTTTVLGAGVTAFETNLVETPSTTGDFKKPLLEEVIKPKTIITKPEETKKHKKMPSTQSNKSLLISNNDLLAVKGEEGIAVISIIAETGKKAKYTWRFMPSNGATEQNGIGDLYEKYAVARETDDSRYLIDLNGKLKFKAGPFYLKWSYSSDMNSWLYGDEKVELGKLPDTSIKQFSF